MLLFVVTVKSRQAASDWDSFSALVNRCLTSLTRQTSPDYAVVVVCDELPEPTFRHPKVHDVHVPGPGLSSPTWGEGEADRAKRLLAGAAFGAQFSPDFVMNVDCDDLVHRDVAAFVNRHPQSAGWYLDQGYAWRHGSRWALRLRFGFNNVCGTCMIVRPELLDAAFSDEPLAYERTPVPGGARWFDHRLTVVGGHALRPLPLPGAVYFVATGENLRADDVISERSQARGRLQFVARQLKRMRPRLVDARFRRDFGL